MKNFRNIAITALAVVLFAMAIGYAETGLNYMQPMSPSYNPKTTITKTAAYTAAATDDYIKVTTSSADIVITLPEIATLTKSARYKILKTDATTYKVIVTPATGDTIGGESTRYLIHQNGYMLIKSGANKNWVVEYESPYIVEDHEAGTFTTGIGSGGAVSKPTTSGTLTASDCGKTFMIATTLTEVLPATVANCKMTFVVNAANTVISIDPDAADQIFGMVMSGSTTTPTMTVIAGAAGEIVKTASGSVRGDSLTIIGDGTDGWLITSATGTTWQEASP